MKKIFLIFFTILILTGCGTKKSLPAVVAPALKGISLATIAMHNSPDDCWLLINNNVYNVSDYLGSHPGGERNIANYCGQEAAAAFETRPAGSGTPHSDFARSLLAKYYIGDLAR